VSAARNEQQGRARLPRRVLPELLDELPADDPRAVRSRRDLKLVNRIMGAKSALLWALDSAPSASPRRIVELGAGDGTMALRIARARANDWPGTSITLLDRHPVVAAATLAQIREFGWSADVATADVFDWLAEPAPADHVVLANLFVHHFDGERLARLLSGLAARARLFVCYEPRRSRVSLAGSHLLGLIGCNDVTRHDAVLSVHAGFHGSELTQLWRSAQPEGWTLRESAAGPFGHLFAASRQE
jgi:hypothetical protein